MSKKSTRLVLKPVDGLVHGESFLDRFMLYHLSVTSSLADQLLTDLLNKDLSLSLAEWRVMLIVGEIPGLSTDELAGRTTMNKAKVSRAIIRLSDMGLINRELLGSDRRINSLTVTKLGRKIFVKCVQVAEYGQQQLLSGLSKAEKTALFSLLHRIHIAQKCSSEEKRT